MILRERGTRLDPENIQERGEKIGVKLHIAAWINWHTKAEKLEFYNDENDFTIKAKKPPKPRRSRFESDDKFQGRLDIWEASIGHDKVVKPKGNAITQKYYTERLLPVYIHAIQEARMCDLKLWVFQEDNDPSYGTRKPGLAHHLKEANWIDTLIYPA